MKKIIIILSMCFFIVACSKPQCESELACLNESIEEINIEQDAKIHIGVYDEDFGLQFTQYLNTIYPGVYSYELIDEVLMDDLTGFDIVQARIEFVPLMFNNITPIDDSLQAIFDNEYTHKYSKSVNQVENYFMPFDVKGMLFAYNKSMLESFGVDLTDENGDGLPESIDSFEKISELSTKWKNEQITYRDDILQSVFTFPFNEQLLMSSFIHNSGYTLVDGIKGENLNIGEPLYDALTIFSKLGETNWQFDEERQKAMQWNYEQTLDDQSSPFLFVGNWMYYEQLQKSKGYELVFSKLPTLNEADLTTISTISGFVLNKDSLYPNAQNIVLRALKSKDGLDKTISSGIIPIIDPHYIGELAEGLSDNLKQQIQAYTYSESMSLQAFEHDPTIVAYQIYYEVNFSNIWKQLFLGELTVEEAYNQMVDEIEIWVTENNLVLEEERYELESNNSETAE